MRLNERVILPVYRRVRRAMFERFKARRRDVFAIDIDNSYSGFFAQLNWCLYVLDHCDKTGLVPDVRLLGGTYTNVAGHDWLHDYFEDVLPAQQADSAARNVNASARDPFRITHIQETSLALASAAMTLERANQLWNKYLRTRDSIAEYVDAFVGRHYVPGHTMGVHFRGTDKGGEAESVPWERFASAIEAYASTHVPIHAVFVASDDAAFIEWLKQRFSGRHAVFSHEDQELSVGDQPIHLNPAGNRDRKGFEALVNCLLLSRCDALIRSASFLSGWSNVFNPALPVMMLNRPFDAALWFPDREVLKHALTVPTSVGTSDMRGSARAQPL